MNEPMNQGIQMLLERMKTNPEEFRMDEGSLYSGNKWGKLVHDALRDEVFSEEERSAVREAFRQARRDNFTGDVVRTLTTEVDNPIKQEWMNEAIVKSATARNLITSSINSGIISNKLYNNSGVPIK